MYARAVPSAAPPPCPPTLPCPALQDRAWYNRILWDTSGCCSVNSTFWSLVHALFGYTGAQWSRPAPPSPCLALASVPLPSCAPMRHTFAHARLLPPTRMPAADQPTGMDLLYYCLYWAVVLLLVAWKWWHGGLTDRAQAQLEDLKSFAHHLGERLDAEADLGECMRRVCGGARLWVLSVGLLLRARTAGGRSDPHSRPFRARVCCLALVQARPIAARRGVLGWT